MAALAFGLLVSLFAASVSAQFYSTKFDNINIDQILSNERLLNSYFNCLIDRGRCTPDGEELKRTIPDALHSSCSKCSARQREGTDKVIRYLIERKPQLFSQLERKYDPSGYYRQRYRSEAARRGIRV